MSFACFCWAYCSFLFPTKSPLNNSPVVESQNFRFQEWSVLERHRFSGHLRLPKIMPDEGCFIFSINGAATIYSHDETYRVGGNEGILMKCGHYLNEWHPLPNRQSSEILLVRLYPELLRRVYENDPPGFLTRSADTRPVRLQRIAVDNLIRTYVHGLQFYFDHPSLVNDELITLKLKELLLLLVKTDPDGNTLHLLQNLFRPDEYDLRRVVEAHLYDRLSLAELANLCHLSEATFKRRFRTVFNEPPATYVRRRRLERAADLLRSTNDTVAEIAYDCGFSDAGYFGKLFRREFGAAPVEWRRTGTSVKGL